MAKTFLLGATSLYEEYQKHIHCNDAHKNHIKVLKETVRAIIIKKRLVSCMNTTKWLELQNAVDTLSFAPAYVLRCVTDKENDLQIIKSLEALEKEPAWYIGNWGNYYEEAMPPLFNIEWIKVRPQLSKHQGRLIKPEIIDETDNFRAILKRLYIPYEEKENIFTIYGYRASFS